MVSKDDPGLSEHAKRSKASNPTAKLDPELHQMIKHITTHTGEEIGDYLDRLLRPHVLKDFADFQRALAALGGQGSRRKPRRDTTAQ